jgi:hypothetical protein
VKVFNNLQKWCNSFAIIVGLQSFKFEILLQRNTSFESETTGPIGTKFVRNVDWMILVVVFCLLEVHNETRGQRCKTKKVLSVFVCRAFIFQPILVGFFLLYVPGIID